MSDVYSAQSIDDIEFLTAMKDRCGYRGSPAVLLEVFRTMDSDGNGSIGFDELFEFVRGRQHPLDSRRKWSNHKQLDAMRIHPPEGVVPPVKLDEIVWDTETLRILVQQMISRENISPTDLLQSFDKSGDGVLSQREFLAQIQHFLQGYPLLWEHEVKVVAQQAFTEIDLRDTMANVPEQLDIVEIARWLGAPTARPKKFEVITKEKRSSPLRRRGSAGGAGSGAFGSERGASPKRPSITSAGASDGEHGHGPTVSPPVPLGTTGFELTWRGRPWWTRLAPKEAHAGSCATAMGVLVPDTSDPAGRIEERAAMLSRLREAEAVHEAAGNSCWCASSAMGMQGVGAGIGGKAALVPGRRSASPTFPSSYLQGQRWLVPSAIPIASGDAREHRLVVLASESSMAHTYHARGDAYPVTRPEHRPCSPRSSLRSSHSPPSLPSPQHRPLSISPPCSPRLRVSSAASHQSRLRRRSADPLANQLSRQIYGFVAL